MWQAQQSLLGYLADRFKRNVTRSDGMPSIDLKLQVEKTSSDIRPFWKSTGPVI
jgi:hypothetical protein